MRATGIGRAAVCATRTRSPNKSRAGLSQQNGLAIGGAVFVIIEPMKHTAGRQLGEALKPLLQQLRELAKQERASRGPDADALEIAIVNLDSAIEILTE